MSELEASSFKDGRTRWAVPVNPGSCQTERRTLADLRGLTSLQSEFCDSLESIQLGDRQSEIQQQTLLANAGTLRVDKVNC
jgi:hypothetical protein